MPRTERNKMTLNTAGYQPTVFTPLEYKPVEQDYTTLAKAMALQEERKQNATVKKAALDQSLGQIEAQLHDDDVTKTWWNNYKTSIKNNINNAVEAGDYSDAIDVATQSAGDVLSNSAVLSAMKENKAYSTWKEQLQKRNDITERTKRYYDKLYGYNPTLETDDNGNVTGFSRFDDTKSPVTDIRWDNEYNVVRQLMNPKNGQVQYKSKDGTIITKKTTELSEKDIRDFMADRIKNDDSLRDAIKQSFEIGDEYIKELKEEQAKFAEGSDEYNKYKALIDAEEQFYTAPNGASIGKDYLTYYQNKLNNQYAKYMAVHDVLEDGDYGKSTSTSGNLGLGTSWFGGGGLLFPYSGLPVYRGLGWRFNLAEQGEQVVGFFEEK